MIINGKVHKLGDFINTDVHCSSKYKPAGTSKVELVGQIFDDIKKGFANRVEKGDVLVAGESFGTVSSREEAPNLLKELGISAVVAKSFGYLFYRNAINMGLPLIECDTDSINEGDLISIDFAKGVVHVLEKDIDIEATSKYSEALLRLIQDGGLIEHIKKNGDYVI